MICFECGGTAEHQHHVVPRSLGGTRTVPLCATCHGKIHGIDFSSHGILTKAGLIKAAARGALIGNRSGNRNRDTGAAKAAWSAKTQARQAEVREVCLELIAEHGEMTTRKLADHLNQAGYKTVTGKDWSATQVWRIIKAAAQ